MSDFRWALLLFAGMFALSALLAVVVLAIDAYAHVELASDLVKAFCATMLACVSGITGLFAGQHIERRKQKQPN